MPRYSFRARAERLRRIGDALPNSADQAVVKSYADELEALARCEVRQPEPLPLAGVEDPVRLAVYADILKRAFPLDTNSEFDALLVDLARTA